MLYYNKYIDKRESLSFQEVLSIVKQKNGCNPKRSGSGYIARCTAHDDRNASLSITQSNDGTILMYCHAGCSIYDICAALGISVNCLFSQHNKGYRRGR